MNFYNFLEDIKSGYIHSGGEVCSLTPKEKEEVINAVPFVFVPEGGEKVVGDVPLTEPLDLPFKSCFFEMLGRPISASTEDGKTISIMGIYINEVSPKEYEYMALLKTPGDENTYTSVAKVYHKEVQDHFFRIVTLLLERMSSEEVGFCNPRKSVKFKFQGQKIQKRIEKIVYVAPKKKIHLAQNSSSKEIDWSHQWAVRGHWRVVERVGKDRDGLPISGYTWIRPHVKGPENAPFVSKTRVVISASSLGISPKIPVQN